MNGAPLAIVRANYLRELERLEQTLNGLPHGDRKQMRRLARLQDIQGRLLPEVEERVARGVRAAETFLSRSSAFLGKQEFSRTAALPSWARD